MIRIEQDKVFTQKEMKVIHGAFELNKVTIGTIMKPMEQIYCIENNRIISKDLVLEIQHNGYSRIPVYEHTRSNIKHIFLAKDLLIFQKQTGELTIHEFIDKAMGVELSNSSKSAKNSCLQLHKDTKINDALNHIQENKRHMIIIQTYDD